MQHLMRSFWINSIHAHLYVFPMYSTHVQVFAQSSHAFLCILQLVTRTLCAASVYLRTGRCLVRVFACNYMHLRVFDMYIHVLHVQSQIHIG